MYFGTQLCFSPDATNHFENRQMLNFISILIKTYQAERHFKINDDHDFFASIFTITFTKTVVKSPFFRVLSRKFTVLQIKVN